MAHQPDLQSISQDAKLIKNEIMRCKDILQQMSGNAEQIYGELPAHIQLEELIERIKENLPKASHDFIKILNEQASLEKASLPKVGLIQALSALVKNGLDASTHQMPVYLNISQCNDQIKFSVKDLGDGIPQHILEKIEEPFFTTKEPERGMELGLFLVKLFSQRLDGTFEIKSQPQHGTEAILTLPIKCGALLNG